MSTVQTIRGPVDTSMLGRVLIHEHVFLMDMEYTFNYRPDFFDDKTITDAAARLNELKAAGITDFVHLRSNPIEVLTCLQHRLEIKE